MTKCFEFTVLLSDHFSFIHKINKIFINKNNWFVLGKILNRFMDLGKQITNIIPARNPFQSAN